MNFYHYLPYKIDPIIYDFKIFKIGWYWLMYLVAFIVVYLLIKYRYRKDKITYIKKNLNQEKMLDVLFWMFLGVILGGRLGYVLLYDFFEYLGNPLSIINPFRQTEEGFIFQGIYGMSYHGGLIGSALALLIYSYKNKLRFLKLADFIIPCIPLGFFFGRIGNFLNGELYGRITTGFPGMYFPEAYYRDNKMLLRHPSQIYEAFFEGLVIFVILWNLRNKKLNTGTIALLYLFLYGLFRFFIEFLREPDAHIGLYFDLISRGQIYSLLMIIISLILYIYLNKKTKSKI
ncbi:MAG: prolipoprotein diacylglyceryl transferase [Candidatus Moranbacteria bacterium]|nr:prolipoprotein diacylglyceryl transferase [Candidatus Moranbacteria bacterium]